MAKMAAKKAAGYRSIMAKAKIENRRKTVAAAKSEIGVNEGGIEAA